MRAPRDGPGVRPWPWLAPEAAVRPETVELRVDACVPKDVLAVLAVDAVATVPGTDPAGLVLRFGYAN